MILPMRDEQIDLVFKALAHPERRRIIASLRARPEQSLFEICVAATGGDGQALSRQTVSQHLEMLERAGLVVALWKGRTKAHSVDIGPLRAAVDLVMRQYLEGA
jgi:DNA-binding transcriptional ArsR family regulator